MIFFFILLTCSCPLLAWLPLDIERSDQGVSLVAEQVEMRHLIMAVADVCDRSVSVSPELNDGVSMRLLEVSWEDFLKHIGRIAHVDMDEQGGVTHISPLSLSDEIPKKKTYAFFYQPKYRSSSELVYLAKTHGIQKIKVMDDVIIAAESEDEMQKLKQLDVPQPWINMSIYLIRMDEDKMLKQGLDLTDWSGEYLMKWPLKQWLNQVDRFGIGQLVSQSDIMVKPGQLALLEAGEDVAYRDSLDTGGQVNHFRQASFRLSAQASILDHDWVELDLDLKQAKFKPSSLSDELGLHTQLYQSKLPVKINQNTLLASFSEYEAFERDGCHPWFEGVFFIDGVFCHTSKRLRHHRLWLLAYIEVKTHAI